MKLEDQCEAVAILMIWKCWTTCGDPRLSEASARTCLPAKVGELGASVMYFNAISAALLIVAPLKKLL